MTLDEAIKHAEEAAEQKQLAEWLKDYKRLLEQEKWIPVGEKMPEEKEWAGTKLFGTTMSDEVYVTFECSNGARFTEHLAFQNEKVPPYEQQVIGAFTEKAVPIAWKPLPKPYKAESED